MIVTVLVAVAVAVVVTALAVLRPRRPRPDGRSVAGRGGRVLFPFTAEALSSRALDGALRLARTEGATLVPIFLARVPLGLPLDVPLPTQCASGLPLLETIEQRAAAAGVPVDARVERGRTYRHALREAIRHTSYARIVVAAASRRSPGFHGDDIAWLLDEAPGEVVVIRPAGDEPAAAPPGRASRPRPTRQPESPMIGAT